MIKRKYSQIYVLKPDKVDAMSYISSILFLVKNHLIVVESLVLFLKIGKQNILKTCNTLQTRYRQNVLLF